MGTMRKRLDRPAGEGQGRTTCSYVVEESDRVVVPTKEPNKGGEPLAEVLEERTRAKEDDDALNTVRAQRRTDRATEAIGVRRGGLRRVCVVVIIRGRSRMS